MHDGVELINRINGLLGLLPTGVHQIAKYGTERAKYDEEYRMLISQETLKEQTNGTPATLIRDIVRGNEKVAHAKFMRDRAEAFYKAAQESVNVNKLTVNVLKDQINREWSNNE